MKEELVKVENSVGIKAQDLIVKTELTPDEMKTISSLLSQITLPVNQAPVVIQIINKLGKMIDEITH